MVKRAYGIEVYYATHGWMCGSCDPDIRWAWSVRMPSYKNRHMYADARPIISQLAFPTFEEVGEGMSMRNIYKMNPYIKMKLRDAGFSEDKDWHINIGRNTYTDANVLFRTKPVLKVFYDTLIGIKKLEYK